MVDTPFSDIKVASREVVMGAARCFAGALAETPQFTEFEQALFAFRQDDGAQQAIRAFREKQAALKAVIMLNALSDEDRAALQSLADQVNSRPSVLRYNQAQADLVTLAQAVGDRLSQAIGLDFASVCRTGGCCG